MLCPNCDIEMRVTSDTRKVYSKCIKCNFTIGKNHLVMKEVYFYLTIDTDNNEGVIALEGPLGPIPAFGADLERMKSFESYVLKIVEKTGTEVRLVKFSNKSTVQTYRKKSKGGKGA